MTGKHWFHSCSSTALSVAVSLVIPTLAYAQPDSQVPKETGGLEEVTVTARKTSELLQSTPVAVTAISDTAMVQQQLFEVLDLGRAAPDVAVTTSGPGGSTVAYISIRGQAKAEANSVSDSAVATYVDGVYYARPVVGNLGFLDVASIEVLRGPQGTLFGRNTTGGALNITSKQPSRKLEGNFLAGYGDYADKRAEAAVNIPLMGDELAVRVAGRYNAHDNYFDNPITGGGPGELKHDVRGRAILRWAPSSLPLSLSIAGDVNDERDTATAISLAAYNPGVLDAFLQSVGLPPGFPQLIPIATGQDPAKYVVSSSTFFKSFGNPRTADPEMNTLFGKVHAKGFSATVEADVGPAHLKSITAYRDSNSANSEDLDATPVRILSFVSQYIQHQTSEELQLSGTAGKWDLIGGLYYFKESGSERSDSEALGFIADVLDVILPPAAVPPGGIPTKIGRDFGTFSARSKAAYFQTNYHITDTVRATAGYRYTWDDRDLTRHGRSDIFGANLCAVGADVGNPVGAPCDEPHSASFSYPAYVVGLDWQALDNLFLYVKTSKASMAGGFNTRPVPLGASVSYAPESNKDIEVGLKSDTFQRRLRTNLALFYAKQTGTQNIVNAVVAQRSTQYTTNAGDSRKYGVELEVSAIPWENMEVQLSGAYLHAAYVPGTYFEQQVVNGATVNVNRSGEPVPLAPKYTFGLGATQTVPLSFGKLAVHADYAYKDSVYYSYDTPAPGRPDIAIWNTANQLRKVGAYGLVNARISFNLDQPNLELALWGRNLADKQYNLYHFSFYTQFGVAMNYQGDPRTYGATLTYKF
jgi:iron complex outermembrane receptor protein